MTRRLIATLLLLLAASRAEAAIDPDTTWEFRQDATANMVNGGGFNRTNAAFPADLSATGGTGNAPVLASGAYEFVAGDIGHWVYVASGADWTPGWYKITAVDTPNAGDATVDATIGAAVQIDASGNFHPNTAAGIATSATPSSGVFGVDYSQGTTAIGTGVNGTATCTDGAPSFTSASHTFAISERGNMIHLTAGTNVTAGWYEITSTSAGAAILDRACGAGSTTNATFYAGGALKLGGTVDDDFLEAMTGGNRAFIKYSATAYATGEAIGIASTNCDAVLPCVIEGYDTIRGDAPLVNQPTISTSTQSFTAGQYSTWRWLKFLTAEASGIKSAAGTIFDHISVINTSTTAGRYAIYLGNASSLCIACEGVSQNGIGIVAVASSTVLASTARDSVTGINIAGNAVTVANSVSIHNSTNAILTNAAQNSKIIGNTLVGAAFDKVGIGINTDGTTAGSHAPHRWYNNILYGFVTGIDGETNWAGNLGDYNDLYFNTTLRTNVAAAGLHDLAVDPQFVGVTELQFTGGASANNSILTITGANLSSVTAYEDFVHITDAGTNGVVGIYRINAVDDNADTLTLNNDCDTGGNGSAIGGWISTGRNVAIGTNLRAAGFPGTFPGALSTGYLDTGAVQRQETTPTPLPCIDDDSCPAGYVCRTPIPG